MKIGAFIRSIIFLVISIVCTFIFFALTKNLMSSNQIGKTIGTIILLPFSMIFGIGSAGCGIASIVSSIFSITSKNKVIKIFSILILVISISLVTTQGIVLYKIFN